MDLLKIFSKIYSVLSIILLIVFFSSFYFELKYNNEFRDHWIIKEKNSYENYLNISNIVINKTDTTIDNKELKKITTLSNNLLPFIVGFWAYLLRKDFKELYDKFRK